MTAVRRFDRITLPGSIKRTADGFIEADPVCTRTGIFEYQLKDGTVRRELRLPDEVFHADSLASAKMIPITNGHPSDFVTSENVGALGIGTTGENARRDGETLRVPIKITNKDGVEAVEGGRLQLSFGYTCNLEMKGGVWQGQRYDAVQSGIVYNHLALCDEARAGASATLRLDSEDAVMVETGLEKSGSRKEKPKMDLVKLRLDSSGITYDVPAEVEAEYGTMRKDRADAVEKSTAETKAKDELQAKHDALTEEVEKLKKIDHTDAVAKGVAARSKLLEAVKPMVSEEVAKKLDGMTDAEVRLEGIKSQVENFDGKDADGKDLSEDYLAARLIGAVEKHADALKLDEGGKVIGDGTGHKDSGSAADARERMKTRHDGTGETKDKK